MQTLLIRTQADRMTLVFGRSMISTGALAPVARRHVMPPRTSTALSKFGSGAETPGRTGPLALSVVLARRLKVEKCFSFLRLCCLLACFYQYIYYILYLEILPVCVTVVPQQLSIDV